MEHEQRTIHEPSSSTSAYCSTPKELDAASSSEPSSSTSAYCSTQKELDAASSSVYTSVVGNAENPTSSRYWTSIEFASDSDDESYVRVLPAGRNVPKYKIEEVKLLRKIGEGGQGTIYTAQLSTLNVHKDAYKPNDGIVVVKLYKGGRCGQWPEDVFNFHFSNPYICQFYGYCLEGDSFYLFMRKYDCSLRDVLDIMEESNRFKGRPLPDNIAVLVIIQIAIGMCFLHENNIIHRDLKADNVFVTVERSTGEFTVRIGDFDVAPRVVGTLFWRAPEVLQALKEGKRPLFTPKADVYSFAMTCYEILTGGVPLEGVRASDYDAILQHGKRPKLPSKLNPKVKTLIRRCWHQDPEARPTFKEILVELKEFHRELITGSEDGSKAIDVIISYGSRSVDIAGASPEASLLELKALIQSLLVKYGEEDFVLVFVEVVADVERYQSEFGFRSFEEHPVLPYPEWFAREKLLERFFWNEKVFERLSTPIVEALRISNLLSRVKFAINRNRLLIDVQFESLEMLTRLDVLNFLAWEEECAARVLPESRHAACLESPEQACDLCRAKAAELNVEREGVKCCLYVDSGFASMVSSLKKRIGSLF